MPHKSYKVEKALYCRTQNLENAALQYSALLAEVHAG